MQFDPKDQRTFYEPQFFIKEAIRDKEGKIVDYIYKSNAAKYWEMRKKGDWSALPKIYEDDCVAFY